MNLRKNWKIYPITPFFGVEKKMNDIKTKKTNKNVIVNFSLNKNGKKKLFIFPFQKNEIFKKEMR